MRQSEPTLAVGLLTAPAVSVTIHTPRGNQRLEIVRLNEQTITINGIKHEVGHEGLALNRQDETFTVDNVVIGINFHWQQNLNLTYCGRARAIMDGDNIVLINDIPLEAYLVSVISSEMSPHSSPALLRAHAIISRSWALAQLTPSNTLRDNPPPATDELVVRWYDHDDHRRYDICGDDHCQRYQGITRVTNNEAARAVSDTRGITLVDNDGNLCDARFSKCCGGVTEQYSACWGDHDYHYLDVRVDSANPLPAPDLYDHAKAREWITTRPDAWCANPSDEILLQVLNRFDLDTTDFYRWSVTYRADTLGHLISRRSGLDIGDIVDLVPLKRGGSGRIILLKIIGKKKTVTVGKELEIRRWLSESHLYSSAFVVDKGIDTDGTTTFTLRGAGWGHGVGLCQIGAAVMSAKGYDHPDILAHYYPGARLVKQYD